MLLFKQVHVVLVYRLHVEKYKTRVQKQNSYSVTYIQDYVKYIIKNMKQPIIQLSI